MLVTEPMGSKLLCRDPEVAESMSRDALIWRQGYRARTLAEILQELLDLLSCRDFAWTHMPGGMDGHSIYPVLSTFIIIYYI